MIRSFILAPILCLLTLSPAFANASFEVEFRTAAFIPSNHRFREIYGDVWPSFQIEASYDLWRCIQLWANIDEFYRCGHVDDCGNSTINILTTSFGPKYVYCYRSCMEVYAGVGLGVAWTYLNNHCFPNNRECNTSAGLAVKSGVKYTFYPQFFLDLFVDYSYQPAFHNKVDIGGVRTGLGIGYRF